MTYSTADLRNKIRDFHPEIESQGMDLEVTRDKTGKRFALRLSKDGREVGAYLDQKDADECMSGKKCLNLAVHLTQLLADLEDLLSPRKPG
jgi:hypothetical protein